MKAVKPLSFHCLPAVLIPVLWGALFSEAQVPSRTNVQAESDHERAETPSVDLSVDIDGNRSVEITLSFDSRLAYKRNVAKTLSTALNCPLDTWHYSSDERHESMMLYTHCQLPLRRNTFLTRTGEINLQPFKDIWITEPNIAFSIALTLPPYESVRCDPTPDSATQSPAGKGCIYFLDDLSAAPRTVHFAFGYDLVRTYRKVGVLAFLLLIPIAMTFWFRRRAVAVSEDAKAALSFAYRRFLIWTALLGALGWWAAIDLLHAGEFVAFLLPSAKWDDAFMAEILPWILLWFSPAIAYFLCLALSSPMDALRGAKHTRGQVLDRSFWSVARFMLTVPFVCLAVAEIFNSPRLAVLLFAGSIVAGRMAQQRFARAYGLELHALTTGELRDRAFAIAQKAGAKLNQLYVLPTERIRMANAFAHVSDRIYLTDYLVKNMSKREVDAIIGHEVTHLQNKHIRRKMAMAIAAILVFAFAAAFLEYWIPRDFPSGPVFYAFLLLAVLFISRRNEFAADAGAARLTGDPEAMMTALAKLSRLNTMPIHWGKLDEKLLTHPSTLRRIRRLAHAEGISDARVSELLSQSAQPPGDVYSIPATALSAGKIFSTQYKSRLAVKLAWQIILATAALSAGVAFVAQWMGLSGMTLWLVYLLGFVLTIGAVLTLANFLPTRGLPELERLLRAKCEMEPRRGDLFVSLAPDAVPRIYEGNWAWDLGFLSLTSERLVYRGEEAHFALRRDEITLISIGPGPAGWFKNPSVYISWRSATSQEGTFNLRPLRVRSMLDMAAKTRLLARDIENWHRGLPAADAVVTPVQEIGGPSEIQGAPAFGQVTSMSPRVLVRGRFLVRDFFLNMIVAGGFIVLSGLGFPAGSFSSENGSTNAIFSSGALYVLGTVWLTRALLLAPYWRMRERKSPTSTSPTPPPLEV